MKYLPAISTEYRNAEFCLNSMKFVFCPIIHIYDLASDSDGQPVNMDQIAHNDEMTKFLFLAHGRHSFL